MSKECMTCVKFSDPIKSKTLKSWLSNHGTIFSSLSQRPNSKFHTVIMTKRHTEDLRTLTSQEWADILPVLKDSIAKIENYYKTVNKLESAPRGYRLTVPNGDLSGANQPPHFYMRVVPKYKKDWGSIGDKRNFKKQASVEEMEKMEKVLQTKSKGGNWQKKQTVAEVQPDIGAIVISTKAKLANDISAIDQETWNEIGQMLQELMKKMEEKDACHDFTFRIELGEDALRIWREEAQLLSFSNFYSDSELLISLFPRFSEKRWWYKNEGRTVSNGLPDGTMENERYAEMLRDPREYFRIWGKPNKNQEVDQLKAEVAELQEQLQQAKQTTIETSTGKISSLWLIPVVCLTGLVVWLMKSKVGKK